MGLLSSKGSVRRDLFFFENKGAFYFATKRISGLFVFLDISISHLQQLLLWFGFVLGRIDSASDVP